MSIVDEPFGKNSKFALDDQGFMVERDSVSEDEGYDGMKTKIGYRPREVWYEELAPVSEETMEDLGLENGGDPGVEAHDVEPTYPEVNPFTTAPKCGDGKDIKKMWEDVKKMWEDVEEESRLPPSHVGRWPCFSTDAEYGHKALKCLTDKELAELNAYERVLVKDVRGFEDGVYKASPSDLARAYGASPEKIDELERHLHEEPGQQEYTFEVQNAVGCTMHRTLKGVHLTHGDTVTRIPGRHQQGKSLRSRQEQEMRRAMSGGSSLHLAPGVGKAIEALQEPGYRKRLRAAVDYATGRSTESDDWPGAAPEVIAQFECCLCGEERDAVVEFDSNEHAGPVRVCDMCADFVGKRLSEGETSDG